MSAVVFGADLLERRLSNLVDVVEGTVGAVCAWCAAAAITSGA